MSNATFSKDPMGITICMSCDTIIDANETRTGYCRVCPVGALMNVSRW
jgi:hypothetical protein